MKKLLCLVLLLFFSNLIWSQNQAYYVKQTQISTDLKEYNPLTTDDVFTAIIIKNNGVEFKMPEGKYTFIENSKINKVDLDRKSYRYDIEFSNRMSAALFFMPNNLAEPKLTFALVAIPGLIKEYPDKITFFRLVFIDELVINY